MSRGFFQGTSLHPSRNPLPIVAQCGACGLHKGCLSPKMPVYGHGKRGILLVGEAPGENEDKQGRPFVGKAGSLLVEVLEGIDPDFSIDRDCWRTNAIICRPPSNRAPTDKEVTYCQPNVIKALKQLRPDIVIPLGGSAVRSVIGHLWKDSPGSISRWVGFQIPSRRLNAWVCPTFHPSFVLREAHNVGLRLWFERHLELALALDGPPYEEVPRLPTIRKIYDSREASRLIDKAIELAGLTAFDLETNMLKPDSDQAQIVSCAICWRGEKTFAFPWDNYIAAAMRYFVQSDVPKIIANAKFEDRWIRSILGVPINNIFWDTMQAAHVLDNREGISSVKFQSFVRLGIEDYDRQIHPYLESKGTNLPNRIYDVPMEDLLQYNGLDAYYEYQIAYQQMQAMGVRM